MLRLILDVFLNHVMKLIRAFSFYNITILHVFSFNEEMNCRISCRLYSNFFGINPWLIKIIWLISAAPPRPHPPGYAPG
jgi:hypothetical protein